MVETLDILKSYNVEHFICHVPYLEKELVQDILVDDLSVLIFFQWERFCFDLCLIESSYIVKGLKYHNPVVFIF